MSRTMSFLIFFSIVFTIYFLANWYLFRHINASIPTGFPWGRILKWAIILLILAFPISRTWMALRPSPLADHLYLVGAVWLGMMLYLILGFILFDIARAFTWFIPSLKGTLNSMPLRSYIFSGIGISSLLLVTAGLINASSPRVHQMTINTHKKAAVEKLRMVLVTDIHMGSIIRKGKVEKLVKLVNAQQADLVLFGGDMMDDDLRTVAKQGLGELFREMKPAGQLIGVTGNHEYIGEAEKAVDYLEHHGLKIIRDSVVLHESGIYIVGREDRDMQRFAGRTRKPIPELMRDVDLSRPILMLDHQPVELAEKAAAGVDLTLSGHTHDGQMWPLGHLAKAVYGISKGYKLFGNMHTYVSPGYGSWGPPVRIGNRPEIVVIEWRFGVVGDERELTRDDKLPT